MSHEDLGQNLCWCTSSSSQSRVCVCGHTGKLFQDIFCHSTTRLCCQRCWALLGRCCDAFNWVKPRQVMMVFCPYVQVPWGWCCSSHSLTHQMWVASCSTTAAHQSRWLFSQLHLACLHALEDVDILSRKRGILSVMLWVALHCLLAEKSFGNSVVVLQWEGSFLKNLLLL